MANSSDIESECSPQIQVHKQQPKHIRKLNFGQTILNLNTIDKSEGPDANKFIIDEEVECIPRIEKKEFTRKWVEFQNYDHDMSNPVFSKESNQSSTLDASTSERLSQTSPVICISSYNKNLSPKSYENKKNHLLPSPILGNSKRIRRKRLHRFPKSKQIQSYVDDHTHVNKNLVNNSEHDDSQNAVVDRSVSIKDACYYKKRRKYEDVNTENIQLHNVNTDNDVYINKNLLPPNMSQNFNSMSPEISISGTKFRKKDSINDNHNNQIYTSKNMTVSNTENIDVVEDSKAIRFNYVNKDTCNTLQSFNSLSSKFSIFATTNKKKKDNIKDEIDKEMIVYTFPNSPVIDYNKIDDIKDSSIEETASVIESITSNESNTLEQKEIMDLKSDDEKLNYSIEDTEDIKDINLLKNNFILGSNTTVKTPRKVIDISSVSLPYKIERNWITESVQNSDETYYSKAESIKSESSIFQNDQGLEKISHATSSNESVNNKSNQTNICISIATSPERTNSFPAMSLQILDSCKKKRKSKKNSLTTKLQSLVNRQASFVRMWHHQIKQADVNGTSLPHIEVYVNKCTMHLQRQLLEGIVLNDSFNLLNDNENKEKSNLSKSSYKMITIIIVPDIVGKIEMKLESIIKIYPPWDIMDKSKSVLNVTYFKIVSNEHKRATLNQININEEKKRKVLVKDFHCLCLEAKTILSSCNERSKHERVNAIKNIYNF